MTSFLDDDSDHVIGEVGYVTTRIGGGELPGEVQVSFRGASESFIAYGSEPIDRGAQVVVVAKRPGRGVEVTVLYG